MKGDGTDAYGRMTKKTLLKKLAEAGNEIRRLKNAEHDRIHPLEVKITNLETEKMALVKQLASAKECQENATRTAVSFANEADALRAARPLEYELVALGAFTAAKFAGVGKP